MAASNWTKPRTPGSFSGIGKFMQNNKNVKNSTEIKENEAYIQHKQIDRVFPRQKIIVGYVDSQWQADLLDVRNKHNATHYLLTVIDVFSRYAMAEPMKDKTAKTSLETFKKLFSENGTPQVLYTDSGSEFIASSVTDYFKSQGVHFITSKSDLKAALVERFNLT
jgi:hypothetical protein